MIFTRRLVILIILSAVLISLGSLYSFFLYFGILSNLALISVFALDWMNTPRPSQISAERSCEGNLSLAARNVVRIRLRNRSEVPLTLEVRDEPPHQFDISQDAITLQLPAGSEATASFTVVPKRRGNYEFGNINIRYLSTFKLFRRQMQIPQSMRVKVYPNLLELKKYVILARRDRFLETGLRHPRLHSAGTEFESLRNYLPDDDYRRINWKATARTGRLISEEYETIRSQNIIIMIDCGRMMAATIKDMYKLDYAINSALMLGYVCCVKGDKVGLIAFSDVVETYIPLRGGKQQLYRILEALYSIPPKMSQPDYEKAFKLVESKFHKRSLIVVFTDLLDSEISKTLITYLPLLLPHHLPLCITMKDSDLIRLAGAVPDTIEDVYRKTVADQLLLEQQSIFDDLRQNGVLVVDALPENASVATVNQYLKLKDRNLL